MNEELEGIRKAAVTEYLSCYPGAYLEVLREPQEPSVRLGGVLADI